MVRRYVGGALLLGAAACGSDALPSGTGGPPVALVAAAMPVQARIGEPLAPAPVVRVVDALGNPVAAAGLAVTATLAGGGVLGGTTTRPAIAGEVTFNDLSIGGVVGPARLEFAAQGLAAVGADLVVLLPPRATQDRPDDAPGEQLHVVYAVASDGADRRLDTLPTLHRSVASFQRWLAQRTGLAFRLDRYRGVLDITFVMLPLTRAELGTAFVGGLTLTHLESLGQRRADKLYLVYYDGPHDLACGGASWPGQVAGMYLLGLGGLCGVPFTADSLAVPGYWESAALHDLVHTMGIVSPDAPNHTDAYPAHVPETNDLMFAGPGAWEIGALLIDIGGDDYHGAGVGPGLPLLTQSPFLTPTVVSAPPPLLLAPPLPPRGLSLPPHPPLRRGP